MSDTATVLLTYPPMPIYPDGPGYRKTADEPWTAKVELSTGGVLLFNGDLPPTRVVRQSTRHWMIRDWLVDPCVGVGKTDLGDVLRTELPEEPTWFQAWGYWTMVAQAIECFTSLLLRGGAQYAGSLLLNACPISIFSSPMMAAQVTAAGVLTRIN